MLVEVEARLREAFHREIPIVEMFRHPTIRSLAEALEAGGPPAGHGGPERDPAAAEARRGRGESTASDRRPKMRRHRESQQRRRGR